MWVTVMEKPKGQYALKIETFEEKESKNVYNLVKDFITNLSTDWLVVYRPWSRDILIVKHPPTKMFLRPLTIEDYIHYEHVILSPDDNNKYLIFTKNCNARKQEDEETLIFISEENFNKRYFVLENKKEDE